jgi:hypothetical protein
LGQLDEVASRAGVLLLALLVALQVGRDQQEDARFMPSGRKSV